MFLINAGYAAKVSLGTGPVAKPRALIVEDDNLTRMFLKDCLEARGGYEVRDFPDAQKIISQAREFAPDVLIVDLNLGDGPTGLDVLRVVRRIRPGIACVVVTAYSSPRILEPDLNALPAEIHYLIKKELRSPEEVLAAVDKARAGITRDEVIGHGPVRQEKPNQNRVKVTAAQAEILRLLVKGLSSEQIATRRGTTVRAVDRGIKRMVDALGIATDGTTNPRVALVRMYLDAQIDVE